MRGQRDCVGVGTRLLHDAAAMPGWEGNDIRRQRRGKEKRRGTGGVQRDKRKGGGVDTELSQAVL